MTSGVALLPQNRLQVQGGANEDTAPGTCAFQARSPDAAITRLKGACPLVFISLRGPQAPDCQSAFAGFIDRRPVCATLLRLTL